MAKKADKGAGGQHARIETLPTADLIPYARNSRTHSDQQVQQIAGSIQEFGFCNPVLIDATNGIIAGHGRVLAAHLLKLESVPCLRLSHLTDAQKRAYVLADNRIALSSGWDEAMLANELSDLHADDFDMALLGFDADELTKLLALEETPSVSGEIVEDEVPEPPADPITKPGDLWILGDHRLLCGDSTKAADVARLMDGQKAAACVTDPPYNIDYGNIKHSKFKVRQIENDNMSGSDFREFCTKFSTLIKDNVFGCVYVFGHPGPDGRIMFTVLDGLMHCSTVVIWNKDQFTLGRGKYQNKYEPCWFGWTTDGTQFTDDRTLTNVWDFPRPHNSEEHPTMKPIAVMACGMGHSTQRGDLIYDPFLGSGTTLIAAEQLNRKCYGMEISPGYCDVIVKRWENLTGKTATLETT